MMKKIMICLLAIVMLFSLVGCKKEQTLKDGYYTAHMDGYDFGWQEFVTICVSNGEIVTVEYNAAAETGFPSVRVQINVIRIQKDSSAVQKIFAQALHRTQQFLQKPGKLRPRNPPALQKKAQTLPGSNLVAEIRTPIHKA